MFTTDFELLSDGATNNRRVRDAYRKFFRELVLDDLMSPRIRETYYLGFEVGEEYCNLIEDCIERGGVKPGKMSNDDPMYPMYVSGKNLDPSDIGGEVYYLAKRKFPSMSEVKIMNICDIALYIIGHFWKYGYMWLAYVAEEKEKRQDSERGRACDLRNYAYYIYYESCNGRGCEPCWEIKPSEMMGIDDYWAYGYDYSKYIDLDRK